MRLASAIPLDLMREEQDRISRELADAGAALANTEVHWESLALNARKALGLASRIGSAYRLADRTERRMFNQAVFERVLVDAKGRIVSVELAQPFKTFLDHDVVEKLSTGMVSTEDGGEVHLVSTDDLSEGGLNLIEWWR